MGGVIAARVAGLVGVLATSVMIGCRGGDGAEGAYAREVAVLKDGKLVQRFPTEEAGGGQGLAMRYQECLR